MPSCREIDSLVTPYVDGEATATERAAVDAHLAACPPCRRRAEAETAIRQALHGCRPCAPEHLRTRCSRAATVGGIRGITSRYSPSSLSLAAVLTVSLGGVVVYGATRLSPTVLAAQLTLDHAKCFALHRITGPIDRQTAEQEFAERHSWRLHLPSVSADRVQLVGVRNCFCGQGLAIHAMYRHDGQPLSLFVLHDVTRAPATVEAFGHDAVIWSKDGSTYVLLGRESSAALSQLAADMNRGL
jgi:anti-sigma factor (TIGR02949 family)